MAFRFQPELMPRVVERLRALADENRLRILMRLREGECNVTTLTDQLGIAQASVSKHLAVMRQVGLVEVTRQGTTAIYRVKDQSVFEMCEIVCGGVIRHLEEEQQVLAKTLGKSPSGGTQTKREEKR
jgi:DNA-binding transcriptional ArsR family regulator